MQSVTLHKRAVHSVILHQRTLHTVLHYTKARCYRKEQCHTTTLNCVNSSTCSLIFCRFALNFCQSPAWKGWEIARLTTVTETLKCETIHRLLIKTDKTVFRWNVQNPSFVGTPLCDVMCNLFVKPVRCNPRSECTMLHCSRRLALANFPINQIKMNKHFQGADRSLAGHDGKG